MFVSIVSKQQRNTTFLPVMPGYPWGYEKERQALGLTPLLEMDNSTLSNNCGVKRLAASRAGNESLCARSAQLCPLTLILCRDKPVASTEHPGREVIAWNKQQTNNLFSAVPSSFLHFLSSLNSWVIYIA